MTGPVVFTEVICEQPGRSSAFGVSFVDRAAACRYARLMRRAGYGADVSAEFQTEASVETALASAASYFDDPQLLAVAEAKQ